MSLFYKKTEFEKKSTRERYRMERAELYFQKKTGSTPFVFFAIALVVALYAYWGGGTLHFVAAALFAGLGVWQFFYVTRASVTAAEVDERARELRDGLDLENAALNASDLDYDAFADAPKFEVWGYTTQMLEGKDALLRADEADNIGRSSHVQYTIFTLAEDRLEACSAVCSLLADDKEETAMEWPYAHLQQVTVERLTAPCSSGAKDETTQKRRFPAIALRSTNKRMNRSYAIREDCITDAQELCDLIMEKANAARKGI